MTNASKAAFTKGQTVYIQGRYRAKVVQVFSGGSLDLDVYEGLASRAKAPWRGTYARELVEAEKRTTMKDEGVSQNTNSL